MCMYNGMRVGVVIMVCWYIWSLYKISKCTLFSKSTEEIIIISMQIDRRKYVYVAYFKDNYEMFKFSAT